ncbi:hypothetical protein INT44_005372 [Umbelopsis vinacea]|uniref:NADP-dependent oxidoreductase domain-containing protein n=1 Tax=Umbelopsis vinacea TaxID=44442 RepID=A0A8H7Q7Y6_9FUNG|nr:hypothetical protein INT44_005372 [Umbelopsis vinacea]
MVKEVSQTELQVSELSFGAGALSGVYDKIEDGWPLQACQAALRNGINLFDTSPYYGRSEYILGDALDGLKEEFPRSSYYIATKCGRYGYTTKDFDYSAARTRESVQESLKRMKTSYLDVVYCHDVEFVPFENIVGEGGALEALYDLKSQGIIKYVGCSGYPLSVLLKIAEHQHQKGQPLDAVLSYCHYTLQNTSLADYAPRFRAAGVKYLLNASPLGMAMFRNAGPPDWHPAHTELRKAAHQCAVIAEEHGLNIAELASTFSFSGRDQFGLDTTVIGLEKAEEVDRAMDAWKVVKEREAGTQSVPQAEIDALQKIHEVLAPYKNYSWQSPSEKEMA